MAIPIMLRLTASLTSTRVLNIIGSHQKEIDSHWDSTTNSIWIEFQCNLSNNLSLCLVKIGKRDGQAVYNHIISNYVEHFVLSERPGLLSLFPILSHFNARAPPKTALISFLWPFLVVDTIKIVSHSIFNRVNGFYKRFPSSLVHLFPLCGALVSIESQFLSL